jgi:hypothetical protein
MDRFFNELTALAIGIGVIETAMHANMKVPAAGGAFIPDMDP